MIKNIYLNKHKEQQSKCHILPLGEFEAHLWVSSYTERYLHFQSLGK